MLNRLLWVPRMLMVLVLVLALSGGGRGFAYKAKLLGGSGEEVRRGVGMGEGVGSGGRRGKSGAELGWRVRNRSARRPDDVRRNMSLGRVEEDFRAGDGGWV